MFDAAALSTYPGSARGTPRPRLVAGLAVGSLVTALIVMALAAATVHQTRELAALVAAVKA